MDDNTQVGPDSSPAEQPNVTGGDEVVAETVVDDAPAVEETPAEEAPVEEDAPEAVDPAVE